MLERLNCWLELRRAYCLTCIFKLWNKLRVYLLAFAARTADLQSTDDCAQLTPIGCQRMDGGTLSFFDNFVVVDGIPVFHLDPRAERGLHQETSEITCCTLSHGGGRVVTGHKNGSILAWDSAHGRLDGTYENVFECTVAAVQFCGRSQYVAACTFDGNFAVIDLVDKTVVRSNCRGVWESNQVNALYSPIVHWPAFSHQGKYLVYPVKVAMEGENEKLAAHCFVYIFSATYYSDYGKWEPVDISQELEIVLDIPLQADIRGYDVAGPSFSHDEKGFILGCNSLSSGYVAAWPDFLEAPGKSFHLKGSIGKWGPRKLVVTWFTPLSSTIKNREEFCYVWDLGIEWNSTMERIWSHHPHYKVAAKKIVRDPEGCPIVWCDFVERQEGTTSLVTAARGKDMRIVIWDNDNAAPFRIISTGISDDQTLLTRKDMWEKKWIDQEHVPGLGLFSASQSGAWVAVYSHTAGKGAVWDANTGTEIIRMSDMKQRDMTKDLQHVDIEFTRRGNKFALCSANMITVWNPRALDSEESQGVHVTALQSEDVNQNTGDLVCHFSADGDSIGMLRPFSTTLNVWNLRFGYQLMVSAVKTTEPEGFSSLGVMTPSRQQLISDKKSWLRSGRICEFAFSPAGDKLATCMADMSVFIWERTHSGQTYIVSHRFVKELKSKCYPAWAVCFSKSTKEKPCVVVCEDSGWLVWINLFSGMSRKSERQNAHGRRCCKFSADGHTAVLMPDLQMVYVWDLVSRSLIHSFNFTFWLGGGPPDFSFRFPVNVAMSGTFTCVGINSVAGTEKKAVVYPTGTLSKALEVTHTPRNILLSENCQWLVFDELIPVNSKLHESESVIDSSFGNGSQVNADDPGKFPEISAGNENNWSYLWNKAKWVSKETDSLVIMSLGESGTQKTISSKGLRPNRCLELSPDGRRIACMRNDCQLLVFDAYATKGCIPDMQSLSVAGREEDQDYIEALLEQHGPSVLNYPDYLGMTILFHAAAQKNYMMLQWLLGWAANTNHKAAIQAPPRYKQSRKKQNVLKIALDCRSPECAQIVLNYLLEASSHGSATAEVFKESLVYLAQVYPRLFFQVLMHKEMLYELNEVYVHEHVFARSGFKVTCAEHMMMNTKDLENLWMHNSHRGETQTLRFKSIEQLSQKKVLARPYVVTYPWIANIGKDGIFQQLLLHHAPNHIYGFLPLKCVITLKWKLYGEQLLTEEIIHYGLLLTLFTIYSYILGFTEDPAGIWEVLKGSTGSYPVAAVIFLFLSAWLASGNLVRELKQLFTLRKDAGWRGVGFWVFSLWNWVELCSYILICTVIPAVHYVGGNPNLLTSLVATTSILLWTKMLYYAQAFKRTGGNVVMIKEIVKDMGFFLIMAFSVLFGFGTAFFVLFRDKRFDNCDSYTDSEDEQHCDEMKSNLLTTFDGPGRSLLTMFAWMLGELQIETLFLVDGSIRIVAVTLFIFYVMTLAIVLLNLLIAIMGDSYDRVKNTEYTKFLKERAETILDLELMLSDKRKEEIQKKIGKFVHVLFPKYKQTQMQEPEWPGRMRNMLKSIKREFQHGTDRILHRMDEIEQRMTAVEDRVQIGRSASRSSFLPRVQSGTSFRLQLPGLSKHDSSSLSNVYEARRHQSLDEDMGASPRSSTFLEDRTLENPTSDDETNSIR